MTNPTHPDPPRRTDAAPANLAAAAADALDWLTVLRRLVSRPVPLTLDREAKERMDGCIDALRAELGRTP